MTTAFTTQGFQDLLTFPFRTPDDKRKLLIGGVLGVASFIIPVLPTLFLFGYGGLIMRRMILDKAEAHMPEWHDWNEMLSLGLKIGGACLVYVSPMIALWLLSYFGMMAPVFIAAFSGHAGRVGMTTLFGLQMLGTLAGMAGFGLAMLVGLVLGILMPPMVAHVAATNSFAAAFHDAGLVENPARQYWGICGSVGSDSGHVYGLRPGYASALPYACVMHNCSVSDGLHVCLPDDHWERALCTSVPGGCRQVTARNSMIR